MVRPLGIEYPDAWYCVMNRGGSALKMLSEDRAGSRKSFFQLRKFQRD